MEKQKNSLNTTNSQTGLTEAQVKARIDQGRVNITSGSGTKTIGQIIYDNVFTFFNMVNFVLAGLLVYVGSYRNLLFMGVVIANIFIGIFQEIKAKRTIDRLSLLARSGVNVIRDGLLKNIPDQELVEDDVIALSGGEQIPADAVILEGNLEVNESLLTGESRPIIKDEYDELLSGSFVISGKAKALVKNVGDQSYAGQLSSKVKVSKKNKSEIQDSLDVLIKCITVMLVPLGILLFLKDYYLVHVSFADAIVSTSAALISLIPGGLVLLTSLVFVISVIKLSRYNTLVQDMASTETLARVDVLCLDKTGTITEGTISLDKLLPVDGYTEKDMQDGLLLITRALDDDNPTMQAVRKAAEEYSDKNEAKVLKKIPFSSDRKYSGASYEIDGKEVTYIFGAGTFVLGEKFKTLEKEAAVHTKNGERVLVLAKSNEPITDNTLPKDLNAVGLLIFSDVIRKEAPATLDYFKKQGVNLKIISGDDPATAASIAKRAGLENAQNYVDAATLKTDKDLYEGAQKYTVFGRVTPEQKQKLIHSLKDHGHTVAMTGDGVNDVLALKEADTSIAMASGSDAARSVANLVLIDSNFASLPQVVAEGRKQINNLQRSASLYISKTIFSVLTILLFLMASVSYPFSPIQLTLINAVTIGIPSFVLALEPNSERVQGRFFTNVLRYALPAGLTSFVGVSSASMLGYTFGLYSDLVSTLCVFAMTCGGLILIFALCRPFNPLRITLFVGIVTLFVGAVLFTGPFFLIYPLPFKGFMILIGVIFEEIVVYSILNQPDISKIIANKSSKVLLPLGRMMTRKEKSSNA